MNQDIKISSVDGNFKYRVSGLLIVDNKLLSVKIDNNSFYCLPGGHIEIMEDSRNAMIREYLEETGINTKIDKGLFIVENFFESNRKNCHELGIYYLLKPLERVETKDFTIVEKDKGRYTNLEFKWQNIEELTNFKPEFLKQKIKEINNDNGIEHIIVQNDKITEN